MNFWNGTDNSNLYQISLKAWDFRDKNFGRKLKNIPGSWAKKIDNSGNIIESFISM